MSEAGLSRVCRRLLDGALIPRPEVNEANALNDTDDATSEYEMKADETRDTHGRCNGAHENHECTLGAFCREQRLTGFLSVKDTT